MYPRLAVLAALSALCFVTRLMQAQELLVNPSFELEPPLDGGRYTVAPGWTTVEGPSVPGIADLTVSAEDGDYNDNGVVDAADYVLWRNGGPLENQGNNPDVVDQADYEFWRSRFGAISGSGGGLTAIPEPATGFLVALGLIGAGLIGRRASI